MSGQLKQNFSKTHGSVSTAVFPVGGFGTRMGYGAFATPKELNSPFNGKPIIYLAVKEAIDAGISNLVIVHGPHNKREIKEFFNPSKMKLDFLAARGKKELLAMADELAFINSRTKYVLQEEALGLGHSVLQ